MALGILATVHTAQVGGAVAALPAQKTVEVQTPIGFGIVYKAETIAACADAVLDAAGIK